MTPYSKIVPTDKAELKAFLFALLVCCLFIGFVSVVHLGARRISKRVYADLRVPTPATPDKLLKAMEAEPPAGSMKTNGVIPEHFKHIDFKNYSYGSYAFPNRRTIDLTLYNSELSLPDRSGWFAFRNVYYTDITGDGKAEAIVRLSHVKCGGSCDGGADLFYIYALRNGKLKTIWQYETGSYGYGCGLKSFTINNKQLVLELFGRCPKPGMDYPGPSKFIVQDLTFILFEFNGLRFVSKAIEFIPSASTDVKGYQPAIRIF